MYSNLAAKQTINLSIYPSIHPSFVPICLHESFIIFYWWANIEGDTLCFLGTMIAHNGNIQPGDQPVSLDGISLGKL